MGEAAAYRAKKPREKGVWCHASFPTSHGGRGKSLSVWVRLGKANRPQAKEVLRGTLSPATHKGER